eukprot:CAMPEP_0194442818 /NCGR_PEP_ID=MMETSP0176-20130528/126349_1 /TAXON_ID=216777 /ORGANISM="Proboscia alata, Strain PI-D3" /LENGTH=1177 /DNA_ID=CAMNT_0039268975 /DNA_START=33 /DNA_END=3563 /DNA_ORIENTATION=-
MLLSFPPRQLKEGNDPPSKVVITPLFEIFAGPNDTIEPTPIKSPLPATQSKKNGLPCAGHIQASDDEDSEDHFLPTQDETEEFDDLVETIKSFEDEMHETNRTNNEIVNFICDEKKDDKAAEIEMNSHDVFAINTANVNKKHAQIDAATACTYIEQNPDLEVSVKEVDVDEKVATAVDLEVAPSIAATVDAAEEKDSSVLAARTEPTDETETDQNTHMNDGDKQEDLSTAEANRKQNAKSEISIQEDVDEKVSTSAVNLDAPSAVVDAVEKPATISNQAFVETRKETTQVELSDIPIDDKDENQDDVKVIDENEITQLQEEADAEEGTKRTDSGEQGVATPISDEKKGDTASQIEQNGDYVSAISSTDVKKKLAQEDLSTAEVNREQNTELEGYIQEEDIDEKVNTADVGFDAPSAVVDAVEKTAAISNRAFMETTEETKEVEKSDIPIDDNDENQDDVEVIDENEITQLQKEAGAEEGTKRTDSGEQGVATPISDEKKGDTASQIEQNGDYVSAISSTDVKKKLAQEDLSTAEVNREQNTELEGYIQEEDIDEKVNTADVGFDAPSAVVDAVEKTAAISNRACMETTEETKEVEKSDIPIDDNDENQDDVEVIDENEIPQLEEEAGAGKETKQTDSGGEEVATTIFDENKGDTASRIEENGDDVSAISSTDVKKIRAQEDVFTAETDREQNTELEVSSREEDVDKKANTTDVDLDAPSAVVEVAEKPVTISTSMSMKTIVETKETKHSDIPIDEKDHEDDVSTNRLKLENDRLRNEIMRLSGDVLKFQTVALEQQSKWPTLKAQVTPLQVTVQTQQGETHSHRLSPQTISTQLETNSDTAHTILQALEHANASHEAKGQKVKSQANAGRNQKSRMQIKTEVLPGEVARQKSSPVNVQRIEATLKAKHLTELQSLQEQVTNLISKLDFKEKENALALEQLSSKLESTTVLFTDLQAKSEFKEIIAKGVFSKLEQEIAQNKTLRKESWATKTELMQIKDLLKPENEKRATAYQINTLQTQLDQSRYEISNFVERIASYQQTAKDSEEALSDLTELYNTYKQNTTLQLSTLDEQLKSKTKLAMDNQVALNEISEKLNSQNKPEEEEISELKTKMISKLKTRMGMLEKGLEEKSNDVDVMETRIKALKKDLKTAKGENKVSKNNYEQAFDIFLIAIFMVW